MNSKGLKKEDYIYFKVFRDFKIGDSFDSIIYHKDQVLRYNKKWLIDRIHSGRFGQLLCQNVEYVNNQNALENDILYEKIYDSITVKDDWIDRVYLAQNELLYLNDWLKSKIDPTMLDLILSSSKRVITDGKVDSNIIELQSPVEVYIKFDKGEKIDFNDPAVKMLFYDENWLKIFFNVEIIAGEEKERLFNEDFSNAILAQDEICSITYANRPEENLKEYHYFILNEDINVKDKVELSFLQRENVDFEKIYYGIDMGSTSDNDENGYLKVVYISTSFIDSSNRNIEQEVLKIARPATIEEAKYYHNKRIEEYKKWDKKNNEEQERKRIESAKKVNDAYQNKKDDAAYFPGVNGEFVHVVDDKIKQIKDEKYSLEQIKAFYQNLISINSDILKEMCFYGGTIPYILTDAKESREFGDIDIFIPIPFMKALREELASQESFEMIYDSKHLAESCHLTSRINKETNELISKEDETRSVIEFLGVLSSLMNDDNSVCEDGTNPIENYLNSNRDYYNEIQDFGFKAKLFGVNISVFPIYEYKNKIMAKSFSVNELYKFLLGVKVLDNSKISDFVKNVKIYDSMVKILPLEYTLVSKQSAINGNYENRLSKDYIDLAYIMQHKEELGISNEVIEQITNNYPDYSISIAYKVNNGNVDTMSGEDYKQYVLINKGSRNIS
jgi:hypothetical protein